MTIFCFTSTGNSLAAAKAFGGTVVSIPQIIDNDDLTFEDDVIGVVFPVYGFGLPKMVRRFLERAKWRAEYAFAIGTYGFNPGAAMLRARTIALKSGNRLDYAESLLVTDNFPPDSKGSGEDIRAATKKKFEKIVGDVGSRQANKPSAGIGWRIATALVGSGEKLFMSDKMGQTYVVGDKCVKCGLCAKICPTGNITVGDRPTFGDKCECCTGCVYLCPQNALSIKNARFESKRRNPAVPLSEIIAANERAV